MDDGDATRHGRSLDGVDVDRDRGPASDRDVGEARRVVLGDRVLDRYRRFSLYNSPYPAHDAGCAIDLYPGDSDPAAGLATDAPSPVAGIVRETRTVSAPPKPYAPEHDHLILVDVEEPASARGLVARILHVDPAVEAGDRVAIGDDLGRLVRAGFFAPWVGTHLHVGFRAPDRNLHRATGSLPVDLGVDVRPLPWDGTGTVVATGETYAILDTPAHPAPGDEWVGIAADGGGVLDGGLPHYDTGGVLGRGAGPQRMDTPAEDADPAAGGGRDTDDEPEHVVRLNGDDIGRADGRTIDWRDATVRVDGEAVTGLSFSCARDARFGAKLICPDRPFAVGDRVAVSVVRG
ncbi:hypothetical protein [Halovivax cerinus]|uniref:Metalloendopeptidase-like membrane protein n=1 Tax=Halovivax cerinus TaxID=1487865 RepID=A0ABD5NRQ8_9EURY|nr:hypothetical protein [Halovivax cerinus]